MDDRDLIEAETREVGRRIREELARRRISRQALADMARISLSTLEKALAGTRPFTLASTIRLEEALGTPLRGGASRPAQAPEFAPEGMGAYSQPSVKWIEGEYLTVRPSFGTPGGIYTYFTAIRWIPETGHLGFAESKRQDAQFEQAGYVSMPSLSGHIYLVTNESGQHRLIVLGRPTIAGSMFGILTTLQVGIGTQLVPAACPLALIPLARHADPAIGSVNPGDERFDEYRGFLREALDRDFARFHL